MTTREPEFYKAKDGWRWRLRAMNGNILADSGQGYTRKCDAKRGAEATAWAMLRWWEEGINL